MHTPGHANAKYFGAPKLFFFRSFRRRCLKGLPIEIGERCDVKEDPMKRLRVRGSSFLSKLKAAQRRFFFSTGSFSRIEHELNTTPLPCLSQGHRQVPSNCRHRCYSNASSQSSWHSPCLKLCPLPPLGRSLHSRVQHTDRHVAHLSGLSEFPTSVGGKDQVGYVRVPLIRCPSVRSYICAHCRRSPRRRAIHDLAAKVSRVISPWFTHVLGT